MNKKNSVVIVAAIVLLAALGIWVLGKGKKNDAGNTKIPSPNGSGEVTQGQNQPIQVKPVEETVLPEGFPVGFPVEKDARITNNYSAQTESGLLATRQFVSKKTLAENYKLYTDYLKKNGWTINTSVDQVALKAVSATSKTGVIADVSISQNTVSLEVVVDLTFTTPKK